MVQNEVTHYRVIFLTDRDSLELIFSINRNTARQSQRVTPQHSLFANALGYIVRVGQQTPKRELPIGLGFDDLHSVARTYDIVNDEHSMRLVRSHCTSAPAKIVSEEIAIRK